MAKDSYMQLENLIEGKIDSIEFSSPETTRELILEHINSMLLQFFPGCWSEGQFVGDEETDYLIYDLHFSDLAGKQELSSIRLLDFGNRFKLIRV